MLHAKWTPPQNIHLTYLFLGEVKQPEKIIEKLQGIDYEQKDISLKGVGIFGKPPRILFTKADDEAVIKLHKTIANRLNISTQRAFVPHVTLARIKRIGEEKNFQETLEKYNTKHLGSMQLRLDLIQSELTPTGAKYTTLHRF